MNPRKAGCLSSYLFLLIVAPPLWALAERTHENGTISIIRDNPKAAMNGLILFMVSSISPWITG